MSRRDPAPAPKRTLYVAHCGSLFAAWWDDAPPHKDRFGRWPRHRAPDVYHDRVVGSAEEVLATMHAGGILPDRTAYAVFYVETEWAARGVETASAANARRRRKKSIKVDPEQGLFAPPDVAVTGRQRDGYR